MKSVEKATEWAVCSKPIVWGEVVFRHRTKVGIFVGGRTRNCIADNVTIFDGEGAKEKAEAAYIETLKVAERVQNGL